MTHRLKIGISGLGFIGRQHAAAIKSLPQCELSALCDINADALAPFEHEGIRCFQNVKDFFSSGCSEAVLIAMPHNSHIPLACAALEQGLHVLIEKPVAVRRSDAERLLALSSSCPGLKAGVMFCMRRIPVFLELRRLLNDGRLGRIRRINWITTKHIRTQRYYDSGKWRGTWSGEGGGLLLNQCHHQLDLLQWLFCMPARVSAHLVFGKYHRIEVEDEVSVFLEYQGGASGIFVASTGEAPGTERLEIATENGRLLMEDGSLSFQKCSMSVSDYIQNGSAEIIETDAPPTVEISAAAKNPDMHREVIANFTDSIMTGAPLFTPVQEAVKALELENAILLSHLLEKKITLPLDTAVFDSTFDPLVNSSLGISQ